MSIDSETEFNSISNDSRAAVPFVDKLKRNKL